MSARIVYQDVAPGAAEDASVSTSQADSYSTPALLPFGSRNRKNYITLERNLWVLDGSYVAYECGAISFRSAAISGNNCLFQSSPSITITFSERHTSMGISLNFAGDCWCNNVGIVWYQGNTVIANETFYPDGMTYFCEQSVTAYDKVIITLVSTSIPRRRAMLDSISFGMMRIFLRDELRSGSVKIVQEIDPTSRELAANALDWTLSSKQNVAYMFQFKQPVYAYDGNILIGTFYIEDSNRLADRMYDITCTDAIGVLDLEPFPDAAYVSGVNAYTLAQSICAGYQVDMETSLQSVTVKGVITGQTRRGALQQLCFALGAVADTSGTDEIKIFKLATGTATEIEANRTRTGATVKTKPIVTAVMLTAHSYSTSQSAGAQEIEIGGVKYYDTQTVTTIYNPDAAANDKPNVIEIKDATLVSPVNVSDVANGLYDWAVRRNVHDLKFRVVDEMIGDYVQTVTPWGTTITGHYTKATLTLSGFVLADAEVVGA